MKGLSGFYVEPAFRERDCFLRYLYAVRRIRSGVSPQGVEQTEDVELEVVRAGGGGGGLEGAAPAWGFVDTLL